MPALLAKVDTSAKKEVYAPRVPPCSRARTATGRLKSSADSCPRQLQERLRARAYYTFKSGRS